MCEGWWCFSFFSRGFGCGVLIFLSFTFHIFHLCFCLRCYRVELCFLSLICMSAGKTFPISLSRFHSRSAIAVFLSLFATYQLYIGLSPSLFFPIVFSLPCLFFTPPNCTTYFYQQNLGQSARTYWLHASFA